MVGIRADLIERMIQHLPKDCGVTVLSDDAQSIYDFADKARIPKPALPSRLIGFGIEYRHITDLHRTTVPALSRMFSQARPLILSPSLSPQTRHRKLIRCLHKAAPCLKALPTADFFADRDDLLVLFRHRADVLMLSSTLSKAGIAHRIRMSGLPPAIPPWIALALAHHTEPTLSRMGFMGYWQNFVAGSHHATLSAEEAWETLRRNAPIGQDISIPVLREKLLRASPPLDLCTPELGSTGPTIGTIHASKGREAPSVMLALPINNHRQITDEECRVLFVAATRAKRDLTLFNHEQAVIQALPSGRLSLSSPHSCAMEVGLSDDLTPEGLTGMGAFATSADVESAQARLKQLSQMPLLATLNKNFNLMLYNQYIAILSSSIFYDRNCAARQISRPNTIPVIGLRTLAFDPSLHHSLHSPWNNSGFVLAPIIIGFA